MVEWRADAAGKKGLELQAISDAELEEISLQQHFFYGIDKW